MLKRFGIRGGWRERYGGRLIGIYACDVTEMLENAKVDRLFVRLDGP
jgi:hypothetical protein